MGLLVPGAPDVEDQSAPHPAHRAAEVELRATPHEARHTVVDLLCLAEVPEIVIMEIMGHANVAQTRAYRTRRREFSTQTQDAMKQRGDLLDLGEQPHSPAPPPRSQNVGAAKVRHRRPPGLCVHGFPS